jgi:hypothetical protein
MPDMLLIRPRSLLELAIRAAGRISDHVLAAYSWTEDTSLRTAGDAVDREILRQAHSRWHAQLWGPAEAHIAARRMSGLPRARILQDPQQD